MEKITLQIGGLELNIDLNAYKNASKIEILETVKDSVTKLIEEENKKTPIWEELEEIRGCCIDPCSEIGECGNWQARKGNQNIFSDEQHAKSALAMAKISQLMSYYGGRITDKEWEDGNIAKYVICRIDKELTTTVYYNRWTLIAFHTEEQRDAFTSREENIQLLKDYFMIN